VDGTGSGWRRKASLGSGGVEFSGHATRELDLRISFGVGINVCYLSPSFPFKSKLLEKK
jgi:hypothetical protein